MSLAILNDITRCVGCGACTLACRQINDIPANTEEEPDHIPDTLSAYAWSAVDNRKGAHVKRQCMHCLDPTCVSVCPVGALAKDPSGPVTYDESKCIGCRYCMVACPFSVPKYEWEARAPRVRKCIFCAEKRLAEGRQPACTEVCPAGATVFGERDELIEKARKRLRDQPDTYVNHIYGLEEAGGTSVLYLSHIPFDQLGFPNGLETEPYPRLTWSVLSKIPNIAGTSGAMMYGIWWIINRRMKLAAPQGYPADTERRRLSK